MPDKFFVDSNILLYEFSKTDKVKELKVETLLKNKDLRVSPQILFECLNVLTKKFRFSKKESLSYLTNLLDVVIIVNEDEAIVRKALQLYQKHSLQVFDSKIIATALLSGCNILYSEDLQHKQVFERKLKIINPFL